MHAFEYIYVNWMNENSHLPMKSNTCLLQIFGHLLDQGQAFMSQLTAKYEGTRLRISRKGVSCTKWPFLEFSTIARSSTTHQRWFPRAAKQLLRSGWLLAILSSRALWVKEGCWRSSWCISRKASNLGSSALEQLYFSHFTATLPFNSFSSFCCKHFCDMVIFWVMEISFTLHQLWVSLRML